VIFEILGEPASAPQPGECPFDDPALGQNGKAFHLIGSFNNLALKLRQDPRQRLLELRPLVTAIGEQLFQKREQAKQRQQEKDAATAILYIGRMNDGMEQQTQRVYKNMPLLALDFLSRIATDRINRAPLFRCFSRFDRR